MTVPGTAFRRIILAAKDQLVEVAYYSPYVLPQPYSGGEKMDAQVKLQRLEAWMKRRGTTAKLFSVHEWGSHPDENNDDCWTGLDFATIEEAEARFNEVTKAFDSGTTHISLDGPGIESRVRQIRKPRRQSVDTEALREAQMQDAMAFGVDGWNNYEGM